MAATINHSPLPGAITKTIRPTSRVTMQTVSALRTPSRSETTPPPRAMKIVTAPVYRPMLTPDQRVENPTLCSMNNVIRASTPK